MKFGFRTPSFKRSLSAATKGAAKRALMREIVPYYGKRGMGWSNPKKAVYNHYTIRQPVLLLLYWIPTNLSAYQNPQPKFRRLITRVMLIPCQSINGYWSNAKKNDVNKLSKGWYFRCTRLFVGYTPMCRAIWISLIYCGFDYCEMCNVRLLKLQRINPEVLHCIDVIMGFILLI